MSGLSYFNLAVFLMVVSVLSTSCATIDKGMMSVSDSISSHDPVTGKREINLESEPNEISRANSQSKEIIRAAKNKGIKIDDETPYYERVTKIFNRLVEVAHRRNLPWEVHVIDDKAWNAFTIGGGKVFVFTGLLSGEIGVQSNDELAAVLGHEIAHVTARHASEGKGKLAISQIADKGLRTSSFVASFTTNQEAEADKYSVIYAALAGYNPSAGVKVWERLHKVSGSYSDSLLHNHPLNDERASNMKGHAELARRYYSEGKKNPEYISILKCNTVFCNNKKEGPKAGEGGGSLALLETLGNAFSEVLKAKSEQRKREYKKYEKERLASSRLLFRQLEVGKKQGGGMGLFGYAVNPSGRAINKAHVKVRYWSGKKLLYEESMEWSKMSPYEKRKFGVPLKAIQYTGVTISAVYVQYKEK